MVNAVVLAGEGKKMDIDNNIENKSFIGINGKLMIEYVVEALKKAESVDKISVIGHEEALKKIISKDVDYIIQGETNLFENVKKGIEPFRNDEHVLLVTSDIPLITSEAIEDFIKKSRQACGDLCYPIINKQLNEAKYPGVNRTYVRLKEGTFTGGNIVLVKTKAVDMCEEFARKLIAYRKKPWKTSRLLGFSFLIQLLMGLLSIPKLEKRFSDIMKIKAVAIISEYPEIGNDVDKPEDVDMAKKYI